VLLTPSARGATGERITSYDVTIQIQASGDLLIEERIAYDFGPTLHHGIYRDIPDRFLYDDRYDRIYPITVRSVTASGGASADYKTSAEGALFRIKVGDPDETVAGEHVYDIVYTVRQALNGFRDHDELYWNVIGNLWTVPIEHATATVTAPRSGVEEACFAGPERSSLPCGSATVEGNSATFEHDGLGPYAGMTVVVGFPKGAVPAPRPDLVERWSIARAFSVTPGSAGAAGVLLLGFLAWFVPRAWRTGRDRRYRGSPVDVAFGPAAGDAAGAADDQPVRLFEHPSTPVEFEPPDRLRPGQVGTLIDEVANPLDATATIVDLAVRGYLRIEEIPKQGWFGKPDWRLFRLKPSDAALLEYERLLLDGLFEDGDDVTLSSLRTKFASRLKKVEDALYDDAVAEGWFRIRPDKVRARWQAIGWVTLAAGGILEYFAVKGTHYGLVPIPVILAGLVIMAGAHNMPSRTAKGTGVLRRVHGFREFVTHGTEAAKARFAEKENLWSTYFEYLPYAIVFGATERWAKVFEGLAQVPPPPTAGWYSAPYALTFASLASSMDHFAVTTSGTITSTPAGSGGSGFSGGFSGGGGGGGGGGSW
jgi:uncharacterized membrane protein YgcG